MTSNDTGHSESDNRVNNERTVKCPVEECTEEVFARGVHLHVMRSSGDGHGDMGEVPDDVDFESLETVGTAEVEVNYPEKRDTEEVARLCPYCNQSFLGRHGIMIHLGQMAGRKNHPENPREEHDPDDFAIVRLDDDGNVVETVEEAKSFASVGSNQRDVNSNEGGGRSLGDEQVEAYIQSLREEGKDDEADRAEQMLLE